MLVWLFLATLFLFWYLHRKRRFKLLDNYGFNTPPPNFFFGNLLQLREDDLKTQMKWFDEYGQDIGTLGGKIMGWYRGPSPVLWTNSPEVIKEIFIKDSENFIDRPMMDRSDTMPHLLFLKGNDWKRNRSVLAPTFTNVKMKRMSQICHATIDTLMSVIDERVTKGENIEFIDVYQRLTMETIGRCGLALDINCQKDMDDQFLRMVRSTLDNQVDLTLVLCSCFPGLESLFERIFSKRGRKRSNHIILDKCRQVLDSRRANPPFPKPVDSLQLCIDAAGENGRISDDEIVAQAILFIAAGYETTSTALTFTTYQLAKHQDIQDRLRKEIFDTLGADTSCDYDSVTSMQYLDMVLSESMRIYSPIPLHLGRKAAKETVICGRKIPKGTAVMAATWKIHHDPNFWEDPWKFDPERFSPANRDKIVDMTYLPFGDGPRSCIGRRFALMEAKMALVEIFRKYKITFSPETPDPMPYKNKGVSMSIIGNKMVLTAERLTT